MNVSPSPPLPRPFRLLLGIKESLHNVWSQYKYWKPPKYVLSLTVMSESRSIGICQICSECEGTVVQGLRCVGWCRDITLLQSSQKPEKMYLISSRVAAKFCATSLTNVQSWESTGADGLLGLCQWRVSGEGTSGRWNHAAVRDSFEGRPGFFYEPTPLFISLVNAL